MRLQRVLSVSASLGLMKLASACNGIGSGSRPEALELRRSQATAILGTETNRTVSCFPDQMAAVMIQTDGREGDFTARVNWTSSNPDVLRVSNGDIEYPDDDTQVFGPGVMLPQKPGTATVTASFSTFSASYDVEVIEPESMTLTPIDPTVALLATQPLTLKARVAGYDLDVTRSVSWAFDDPDTTVANFSSSAAGLITLEKVEGTLVARPKLLACPDDSPTAALAADLKTTIKARKATSITTSRQFAKDDGSVDPLIVGNSETITFIAHFADTDATHDISNSGVVSLTSDKTAVAGSVVNRIVGVADGTANLTPKFPSVTIEGFPVLEAAPLPVTVLTRTLQSFEVEPAAPEMTALSRLQLRAVGTYQDGSKQEITNHVTWRLADDDAGTAAFTTPLGTVVSLQSQDAQVTVTATSTKDSSKVLTVPVLIKAVP